jgi:hypothetical protein
MHVSRVIITYETTEPAKQLFARPGDAHMSAVQLDISRITLFCTAWFFTVIKGTGERRKLSDNTG